MTLLAILIVAWGLRSSYLERLHATRTQTQNLARAIEAHVTSSIQFVDASLLTLASGIRLLPDDKRNDPAALGVLMLSNTTNFTDDFWTVFIDANGVGVVASNKLKVEGISYADRDFFLYHAQNKGKGLFVGSPALGRASNRKVFFISRKVENFDGKFLGVISAPLDAQRISRVFDNSRFNPDVMINLFHRDGRMIARAPQFAATFGIDMHKDAVFTQIESGPEGTFETASMIDGRNQLFSYRVLEGLPLIVSVGIDHLDALQNVSDNALIGWFGIVLLVLVMLLSGYLALRAYRMELERQYLYRRLYDSSRATEAKLFESERRLRLITDNLPVLIGHIDQNERFTFANKTYEAFFGVDQRKIPGSTIVEVIGKAVYEQSQTRLKAALQGQAMQFERAVERHGSMHWDWVTYVPDRHGQDEVAGIFVMVEDITERKRAEEGRLLTSLVYESTSEAMMIMDANGAIINVNPSFTRLTGYTLSDIEGRRLSVLASERHDAQFFNSIRRTIYKTGQWQGEIWNRHKNGENYLVAIKFNTVADQQGKTFRRVALFSDITKKRATEDLIWKQANFDALTGLPNRRMFHEKLRMEMRKTDRSQLPMALVFIDLDRFKEVNDTLGHAQGDLLLNEAAARLNLCVRGSDTVARLGGDEFTIILTELSNPGDVARIAELILKRMAEPFKLGENEAFVSASIGITLYPDDGASIDVLLKNADQAMYAAKGQGRDRYHYFAPFMQEHSQLRKLLSNELRDALPNHQLRVMYQTIVELKSGDIHKAEALVRWQHPVRGLLNPCDFIGIAETNGLIVSIGDWVFREAAQLASRLQEFAGRDFQICVNKSAMQFRDNGSHYQEWLSYLEQLGLTGDSIMVEVSESLLQDAGKLIVDKLSAFRDAGMQVSLDDFGTGYSSVAVLKRYEIDYLKINPAFVANLGSGAPAISICEAIIAMAHKLGMKVIAEGIETEQQLALLTRAGCDYGQGFLFAKPVRAEELEELLRIRRSACG